MNAFDLEYRSFGQMAILIEWPPTISELILEDMIRFRLIISEHYSHYEIVPAYNSLTLISRYPIEHSTVIDHLKSLYGKVTQRVAAKRKIWNIPVCYDPPFCMDLEALSASVGLSKQEIIYLHTARPYTVYAIGFLPGFMYLGGLDERIHFPRREKPRLKVPRGSVGIGGQQTGIYPQESPGGWNIIGNSPIKVFNALNDPPCGISVGDQIRFYAINKDMHELFTIQVDAGVFQIKTLELDDQSV
ncbi:5-oxoprolinase subunit PxpB [Robertkochia marina]|uniref:5-oxoprolinase subunit PxpB n=1 Tax=Robertkochia marina TaxID=1227945 RepID=A0A4V3UY42_9FLAO|nr:5-oxoprolinase subunit PxpB [Robertkochia marina]THD67686.1 5-oxoprolinase subunit PxpB [Robertkochia marina]TRZ43417.1 5-oxoprolinase subunit PxpB [Robertkochia marina]